MENREQRGHEEQAMNYPPMIQRLLEKYPDASVVQIKQPLNEQDFLDQKTKQNEYPIEGAAIGVVTTAQNEVLLTQRTKPHKGWALPGGRVEKDEPFDDAFTREVTEECGVPVTISGLSVIEQKQFISPQDETLDFWLAVFRGHISSEDVPYQTEEAIKEGLEVSTFPIYALPDDMVLRDKEKVETYFHA